MSYGAVVYGLQSSCGGRASVLDISHTPYTPPQHQIGHFFAMKGMLYKHSGTRDVPFHICAPCCMSLSVFFVIQWICVCIIVVKCGLCTIQQHHTARSRITRKCIQLARTAQGYGEQACVEHGHATGLCYFPMCNCLISPFHMHVSHKTASQVTYCKKKFNT